MPRSSPGKVKLSRCGAKRQNLRCSESGTVYEFGYAQRLPRYSTRPRATPYGNRALGFVLLIVAEFGPARQDVARVILPSIHGVPAPPCRSETFAGLTGSRRLR